MQKETTDGEFFTLNFRRQFLLLSIMLLLCALGALHLGQDINWDLLNYHFYNGYAFIHHRLMQDVAPAIIQTYLNPFLDVLNYCIISLNYPELIVVLLSVNSAILGFFLYKTAVILFSNFSSLKQTEAAFFSVAIGMTGAANVSLLGTATNDVTIAMLIVMAFYFLSCACLNTEKFSVRPILFAGLLGGMAVGFKLTATVYLFGLLIALLCLNQNDSQHKKRLVYFVLSSTLGFLLVNGYWMIVLYQHFQSPLFPYYNNIFHSPFAPYASFNLSPAEIKPHWRQFLFFPYYAGVYQNTFFSERVLRDPRIGMVFVLGIVFIFNCLHQQLQTKQNKIQLNNTWRFFLIFFFSSYFVWLVVFAVYRYLLPLELMTGMMVVYFSHVLFKSENMHRVFMWALFLLMLLTTTYPSWGRMKLGQAYFAMDAPTLPPASIVVLAAAPLAYVIPFFAKDTRFIGMPFVGLGENISANGHLQYDPHRKLLKEVMAELIANPMKVPLYVLTIQKNGSTNDLTILQTRRNNVRTFAILKYFGITKNTEKCVVFSTNIGDVLQLCPLVLNGSPPSALVSGKTVS